MKTVSNKIYISFDCIIDKDFGLLYCCEKYYSNELRRSLVKDRYLDEVINRFSENPLDLICKTEERSKEIKEEIIDKYEEEVLTYSKVTSIIGVLQLYKDIEDIDIVIGCNNIREEEMLKVILKDMKYSTIKREDFNEDDYNIFIIKFATDSEVDKIDDEKSIYLLNYQFNNIYGVCKIPNVVGYIYLIDPYKEVKILI